jgi:hypothetical protein
LARVPVPLRLERRQPPGIDRLCVASAELSLNTKHDRDPAREARETPGDAGASAVGPGVPEPLYPPTKIAGADLMVVGLAYRSDEWIEFLDGEDSGGRFEVAAVVDPVDLRQIEAMVAGRTFRLAAVDQELAMGTSLAVQLAFFGPPSVKVLPPPSERKRLVGSKARRPPERPWVHTLGGPREPSPRR